MKNVERGRKNVETPFQTSKKKKQNKKRVAHFLIKNDEASFIVND